MDALITSTYLGDFGDSGVFRLNLAAGLPSIVSITLEDDNVISGGTGAASGFDLDMIKISSTLTSSPSQIASLPGLPVFNFSNPAVFFQPGFLQPWSVGDPNSWNQNRLFGTANAAVNFPLTTFATLDATNNVDSGSLSIGEGGQITFTLTSPVSAAGLYLYIADTGGGNDNFRLRVSSTASVAPRPGITLVGTSGDDVIDLAKGTNAAVGGGNDLVSGSGGDDTVFGGAGNDTLSGNDGNDALNGGTGNDLCQGDAGDDLLNGGVGTDTLTGGVGSDRFVFDLSIRFNLQTIGKDILTDFTRSEDVIVLGRSTFKRLKSSLQKSDFAAVKNLREAKESDALFTYIRKSGALFYNENRGGSGFGRGGQFADLTNGLNLNVKSLTVM